MCTAVVTELYFIAGIVFLENVCLKCIGSLELIKLGSHRLAILLWYQNSIPMVYSQLRRICQVMTRRIHFSKTTIYKRILNNIMQSIMCKDRSNNICFANSQARSVKRDEKLQNQQSYFNRKC